MIGLERITQSTIQTLLAARCCRRQARVFSLSFANCSSRKKRGLKGDLAGAVSVGFTQQSFNARYRAQETPTLAGVTVEPIEKNMIEG